MTKASKPAKMATTSKAAKPETLDEQQLDSAVAGAIAVTTYTPTSTTSATGGSFNLKGANYPCGVGEANYPCG